MFHQFRSDYPQGSLTSELVTVEYGRYIVRASALVEGVTLATSLASGDTVEAAEDNARSRLIAFLGVGEMPLPLHEPLPTPTILETALPEPLATPPAIEAPLPVPEPLSAPPGVEEPLPVAESFMEEPIPVAESFMEEPLPVAESLMEESLPAAEPFMEEPLPEPEVEAPLPIPVAEPQPKSRSKKARSREPEVVAASEPDFAPEPEAPKPSIAIPEDITDVMIQTGVELKRLGWTNDQGREYLVATYGKRSRQLLTDEELVEFLAYLQIQP